MRSSARCAGCGWQPPSESPLAFQCAHRLHTPDADHVLAIRLDTLGAALPSADSACPFVRFRSLMRPYHVARDRGVSDEQYVELVQAIDEAIARIDGHGFTTTPLFEAPKLAARAGVPSLWVKDETVQVGGSHKARHLMGIAIALAVLETLGEGRVARLAIASCGNAALAASVVARAIDRPLDVFIPTWADEGVVRRLRELGAHLVVCPRQPTDPPGDPCYHRFREAVAAGAIPFSCQGPDNGLTIEGGKTLAYEIAADLAASGVAIDRTAIQVGGGALASALCQGFRDAVALGAMPSMPEIDPVQSEGGHPLERAWHRVAAGAIERAPKGARPTERDDRALGRWLADASVRRERWLSDELAHAARHRSGYMWPVEGEPRSVASGILDDETYDWLEIVRAMVETGGVPLVVGDETILRARDDARETTGISVDATGAAGLAGLYAAAVGGRQTLVLCTGVQR